jgi:hypothetical protein
MWPWFAAKKMERQSEIGRRFVKIDSKTSVNPAQAGAN